MLNPIVFLKPSRLFEMRPVDLSTTGLVVALVVFGLALVCAGIFWWLKRNKKRDAFLDKFYRMMIGWGIVAGVVGLIFTAFRQWQVYFFGARFWYLVWFLTFGFWLVYNIYYLKKIIPKRRETKEAEELFGKYLPKKKK